MSLIKVLEETVKEEKVIPLFNTAADLARALTLSWSQTNADLCNKCDEAMIFIKKSIPVDTNRNSLSAYLFEHKLKKYRKNLIDLQRELQFLSNEVESFIGFNTYMKAGVKSKFKTKKVFDDKLIEVREITAMLVGILTLSNVVNIEYQFTHELDIIKELTKEEGKFYYQQFYTFLSVMRFE